MMENVIDERADMAQLSPVQLDRMLEQGWRLLGYRFVRHNFSSWGRKLCRTSPLRLRLSGFSPSKSQRQVLRRNKDLDVVEGPARFDVERERLFDLHRERFKEKQATTLASFVHHETPSTLPSEGRELAVYLNGKLIACSFFHLGEKAVSATYCVFDPSCQERSLGIFTMLLELLIAQDLGKEFYYHGYVYDVPSQFDYKLNFNGLEVMDWETGQWKPVPKGSVLHRK